MRYLPDRLTATPPVEKWDDWLEYDAKAWPKKVERRMRLVPTICFNCESGCGLLAYVDKETGKASFAVVQAEDEIAALGMAIGAGWAGARSVWGETLGGHVRHAPGSTPVRNCAL